MSTTPPLAADMTPSTILVLGATGGTGKHLVSLALAQGLRVRCLVRDPSKLPSVSSPGLEMFTGSITDPVDTDSLVKGVDYIVAMLGDRGTQSTRVICLPFIEQLVPSMRKNGVKRILFQAGGLSRPYGGSLSPILWVLRYTIARGFDGQHRDNEAVMEYLNTQAMDIEWMVHRAGIGSDGASKGKLDRSATSFSVATHADCAEYNLRTVMDYNAVHTMDLSTCSK